MNYSAKITNYIRESIAELKKVTWPTKKQATNYSLLVVVICVVIAAFLGLCDYLFIADESTEEIISKFQNLKI